MKDAKEKHTDEIRQLQAALKDKDEQEETKLLFKLDELAIKHADEVQRLKAKLREKDEQCTKVIEDIKAEYEEKHKTEEHQKKTEVEAKVKKLDIVANGVLRGMKKEIETLTKNCEEKDATIAGLMKELERMKKESQRKDLETEKQLQKFEEWHKLMIDDAEQMPTSEATPGVSQETVVVNREKQKQFKKNFLLVTEKNMKMERSLQELLEKLEDRDKHIKELQLNAGDNSILPKVYESLSSEEVAQSTEELSHAEAIDEIQKQNAIISELRSHVASLQTKMGTFEKTAAENSKMERHGKEQSKVVMEWRQKYEAAEVISGR